MRIRTLKVANLRNLEQLELYPHDRLNTFCGVNGAGKTSILEAVAVLSRGRSFRSNRPTDLVGNRGDAFQVFAEITAERPDRQDIAIHRQGLERSASGWKARMDGENVEQLSDLANGLPVVVLEPNSHLLVSGSPDVRRRFLDWGVFHVKPDYLTAWRRYARAHKQRNTALRMSQTQVIESLEAVMASEGAVLSQERERYVSELAGHLGELVPRLSENLGKVTLNYAAGWTGDGLAEALAASRAKDVERGSTQFGPHRAELEIRLNDRLVRHGLSRGEQKMLATALVIAQAKVQCASGRVPVVLLDDLTSEFDNHHLSSALECSHELGAQVWVTGVEQISTKLPHSRFHVERGAVQKVV